MPEGVAMRCITVTFETADWGGGAAPLGVRVFSSALFCECWCVFVCGYVCVYVCAYACVCVYACVRFCVNG